MVVGVVGALGLFWKEKGGEERLERLLLNPRVRRRGEVGGACCARWVAGNCGSSDEGGGRWMRRGVRNFTLVDGKVGTWYGIARPGADGS